MRTSDDEQPNALDAYETIADLYASEVETNPHSRYYERPAIRELLGDISGLGVLDAGCGPGVMMEWLVENGAKSVVGVDGTSRMVKIARERLGEKCTLHVADISKPMPFLEDGAFDAIISSATLGYIRDWKALFMEFSR
ncbi:MAG: class I SAM-dependent methyltransferase, partial [bacterium]